MATLPNLDKTVTKDPVPPATDTVLTPITPPPPATVALTTLVMNKEIDNINEIIDYISGDNGAADIPITAITGTKAQYDASLSDGDFKFVGDAPTAHTHIKANITDTPWLAADITLASTDLTDTAVIGRSTNNLGFFAATTSLQLLNIISNETGSGLLVFNSSPTIITPTISGTGFTNAQHAHLAANSGGQITEASISDLGTYFDIAGTGLTSSGATVNVIGTSNRIVANANDIDIASTYVGQTSITTLGTIVTGTWNGTDIAFANVQDIATSRILGRVTAATGVIEELTGTQTTTLLDVFTDALKGLAPLSGGGTTNFLRADGTWVAPSGGSSLPVVDTTSIAEGSADATKEVRFEVDGNNTGIIGVLATIFTTAKTVTFPDATDTLMGKATTDTFTNKTFDANATGNSLSNIDIADHSASGTPDATTFYRGDNQWATPSGSGDMVLAGVQTVTGAKTFADDAFLIQNPAITFEYLFQGGAILGDRTITLPVLTGNDILVFEAHTQTFTNKTLDADGTGNVITNIGSSEIKSEIITGFGTVTGVSGDFVLISDGSDSDNLKKVDVADFLSGASQTPWTSDIDAAGNDLNSLSLLVFQSSTDVAPAGTVRTIYYDDAQGMMFNALTGDFFQWEINASARMRLDDNQLQLSSGQNLTLNDDADIQWGGSADRKIKNTTGGFEFEVETSDTFQFTIQNGQEMLLTATVLDIDAKYIELESISSPGTTGSASTGRLFMDTANSDHLSTIRNGSIIDLEASGGSPALNDLSDVTLTPETTGMVLQKSAGDWVDDFITNTNLTAGTFSSITGVGTIGTGTWEGTRVAKNFLAISVVHQDQNNTYNTGALQTFSQSTTTAPFRISSGLGSDPSTTAAGMFSWTTDDVLKIRNNADSAWISLTAGSGDMILASVQTVTGAKTFVDDALLVQNPAETFEYTIQGGAITGDRTLNLPVISGTDTLMTLNLIQTVVGIKDFTVNAFRLKGGGSGQITLNAAAIASGTVTVPATTDNV